jgi:hypothetical protein
MCVCLNSILFLTGLYLVCNIKLVHGYRITYFVTFYLCIGCTEFNDKNYEQCNWNNVEVLLKLGRVAGL